MKIDTDNPYNELKRVFHEPSRLAIMSALCAAAGGLSFNELKAACDLTDGNQSRHLKTLESAGMVTIKKGFIGVKPRTTVFLSDQGRESFLDYLSALEIVLQRAADAVQPGDVSLPHVSPAGA
ncbi:MAG: transcriptional regulator [Lentisphaeria bacterium]|jgi:DNA-binding transcriptional ArsR family regulator|nr:transcriptional regulator [Lentisphaeria bacterium]MDP7743728.1 transcriptional regulator [Lentisphaeria bacterium]